MLLSGPDSREFESGISEAVKDVFKKYVAQPLCDGEDSIVMVACIDDTGEPLFSFITVNESTDTFLRVIDTHRVSGLIKLFKQAQK